MGEQARSECENEHYLHLRIFIWIKSPIGEKMWCEWCLDGQILGNGKLHIMVSVQEPGSRDRREHIILTWSVTFPAARHVCQSFYVIFKSSKLSLKGQNLPVIFCTKKKHFLRWLSVTSEPSSASLTFWSMVSSRGGPTQQADPLPYLESCRYWGAPRARSQKLCCRSTKTFVINFLISEKNKRQF